MCAVMMEATPASIAALNGTNSTRSSRSGGCSTIGSSWCESVAVSPCPGKCFPQAAIPSACSVRTITLPSRATSSARADSARSPMAGLALLLRMSSTGVKSSEMPTARNSAARARANRSVSFSSPLRPSVIIGGHTVNGDLRRATRPPS
jgi:hypothetical protein